MPENLSQNNIMRIIGGRHRGRRIGGPTNLSVRPTSDRARESLFNIIANKQFGSLPKGKAVLDVFAGTGALGFEALSRGAGEVCFIEWSKSAGRIIKQTACELGESNNINLLARDATRLGQANRSFDLILMDAPYMSGNSETCLHALAKGGWLGKKCICCIELGKQETLEAGDEFEVITQRNYGAAQFVILRWIR